MVLGLSHGWGSRPDVSFIDFSPPTAIVKVQLYSISWVQLLTGITRVHCSYTTTINGFPQRRWGSWGWGQGYPGV